VNRESRPGVLVLWVVPGLLSEGRAVAEALRAANPSRVLVGIPEPEAQGLLLYAQGERDPSDELDWLADPYARHLSKYGAVTFPPPAYLEAARFAALRGVPLEGVDIAQDAYDLHFVTHVSALQWWRYGRRMRRMERRPPKAPSAEAFALAWDRRLRRVGRGIRLVEAQREAAVRSALEKNSEGAEEAGAGAGGTGTAGVAVVDLLLREGIGPPRAAAPAGPLPG
jgi:hypothetical protein